MALLLAPFLVDLPKPAFVANNAWDQALAIPRRQGAVYLDTMNIAHLVTPMPSGAYSHDFAQDSSGDK